MNELEGKTDDEIEALADKYSREAYPKIDALIESVEGLERTGMLAAMITIAGIVLCREKGMHVLSITVKKMFASIESDEQNLMVQELKDGEWVTSVVPKGN